MTIHVEVDSKSNFEKIHDVIDDIEHDINEKYNINLTIHMDPVELNNPELNLLKEKVEKVLNELSDKLSYHDCRLIRKNRQKTLILEIELPYGINITQDLIKNRIYEEINKDGKINLDIDFDRVYIE